MKKILILIMALGIVSISQSSAKSRKPADAKPQGSLALLSYIKVKPGYEERFRKEIAAIIEPSRAEPGNVAWFVQESNDDPTQFVFYTRWVDEDALTQHLQSPPLVSYLKRTAPFLAEPAKLVRFTPVDN
jgi:quinol monooxygenase YgiN